MFLKNSINNVLWDLVDDAFEKEVFLEGLH